MNEIKNQLKNYHTFLKYLNEDYYKNKTILNDQLSYIQPITYGGIKYKPLTTHSERLSILSDNIKINDLLFAHKLYTLANLEFLINTIRDKELKKIFVLHFILKKPIKEIIKLKEFSHLTTINIYKKIDRETERMNEVVELWREVSTKKEVPNYLKLKAFRLLTQGTQEQMGALFNVGREEYNKIEKGKKNLTETQISVFNEAFGKTFISL